MSGTTLSLSALSRQGTRWLPALLGFQYVAIGNTKDAGRVAAVDTKALGVWGWLQKRKVCPAAKPQYHPLGSETAIPPFRVLQTLTPISVGRETEQSLSPTV